MYFVLQVVLSLFFLFAGEISNDIKTFLVANGLCCILYINVMSVTIESHLYCVMHISSLQVYYIPSR